MKAILIATRVSFKLMVVCTSIVCHLPTGTFFFDLTILDGAANVPALLISPFLIFAMCFTMTESQYYIQLRQLVLIEMVCVIVGYEMLVADIGKTWPYNSSKMSHPLA